VSENDYLAQVMENQRRLEGDLKVRKNHIVAQRGKRAAFQVLPAAAPEAAPLRDLSADGSGGIATFGRYGGDSNGVTSEMAMLHVPSPAVDVRITGWWRWKTVIVPPNAHVVHTRRGHAKPLHIGLGTSFRYNPSTDSYLVVPGTMQTILINAQCICRELQGLLVQGYVQWIVADFGTAYTKLDFTDVEDPMRVVNVQLREQAEAAIKDKVATMAIDDVLSDKQPIIEELTARLRSVAEGAGLRIITVQIKEAVVSSRAVWESLQKPFRSERAKIARLAELETETVLAAREANAERDVETGKLETEAQLATLRALHDATVFDREQAEALRRSETEEEVKRHTSEQLHKTRVRTVELATEELAAQAALQRARATEEAAARQLETERAIAISELESGAKNRQAKVDVELLAAQQAVSNSISAECLQARLIELLPAIAEKLPKPDELKAISIGGGGNESSQLASLVAQVMAILDGFKAAKSG